MDRQREGRTTRDDDVFAPETMARVIGAIGTLAMAMSLSLSLFPQAAIDLWPWMPTPLTARVMGAVFALGLAALGAFTERHWSSYRLVVQVEMIMLVLIVVGAVRAAGDLDSSNVLTWLFVAGFASLIVASVVLYVRMEQRSRRST